MGFTFKENCPDVRNTKIADVFNELIAFGLMVDVFDYEADKKSQVKKEYNIDLLEEINENMMELYLL